MPRKLSAAASDVEQLRALVEQLSAKVEKLEAGKTATPVVVQGRRSTRGQARAWVTYSLLGIPQAGTIQPQAIKCCALLSGAKDPANISEPEAMELIRAGADLLETVQDPWHVFQYYRARLIQMNCLRMPVAK